MLSTVPLGAYVWAPEFFPWSPKVSFVPSSGYALHSAFEDGVTLGFSLSQLLPFPESVCHFRLFVLLPSDLLKDLLLPEMHPSGLVSSELEVRVLSGFSSVTALAFLIGFPSWQRGRWPDQ